MLEGVTLADPARIDIRGEVTVGRDVFIDVNAVLVGKVELGDRVRIGPNCFLKDCRIEADTEIHPNCVIDRATVGRAQARSARSRASVPRACCTKTCTSAISSK